MAYKKSVKPTGSGLKLVGIMFLDIKDFSKLGQARLESFIDHILPGIAETIDPYRDQLLELNTWGDAVVAVSENPVAVARIALDIRDFFRRTNFEAKGFSQPLRTRISLHAGTVKHGYDPIRKRTGVIGANVNLAARIEPVITPGEVWASTEFEQMLRPHTSAERLAFDDLGPTELAKNYGPHSLLKLRRSEEPKALSPIAKESLKLARTHSRVSRAFDVVGIGALNTDYIATASSLRKIKPDIISDHERFFELGRERVAAQEEVRDVISQIGQGLLTVSLGGSAFNTIHALSRSLPGLRLAFVGVAGTSEADPDFVETLNSMNIDATCVKPHSEESGLCVSYITRGERSLLTYPGANLQMSAHLAERKSEVIDMLGRSRLVHLTSFLDSKTPMILAEIIREAKHQNPWLQVSFDPGHDWILRIKAAGESAESIREILSLSSYIFVNKTEFELLTSDLEIKNDQALAKEFFKNLSPQALLMLLKKYDEIRIYHRLHRRVKEICFENEVLPPSSVDDATGAGDVFAAGIFVSMLIPGLELRDGVQLGLKMARRKLKTPGSTDFASFGQLVEEYVDLTYGSKIKSEGPGNL